RESLSRTIKSCPGTRRPCRGTRPRTSSATWRGVSLVGRGLGEVAVPAPVSFRFVGSCYALARRGQRDVSQPGEDDTENDGRQANGARTHKKHPVRLHERVTVPRQVFDDRSGESFQKLTKIRVRRRKERVLRGCIADACQARHIS